MESIGSGVQSAGVFIPDEIIIGSNSSTIKSSGVSIAELATEAYVDNKYKLYAGTPITLKLDAGSGCASN
jgi:hypothetical protein